MLRAALFLYALGVGWAQSYTPTSSVFATPDGAVGIGVEANFPSNGVVDQTWNISSISAIELEGSIAFCANDRADILVRIYIGSRMILNENLKSPSGRPDCPILQVHIPPEGIPTASTMRVYIGASGAGNSFPIDAEVEMAGRSQ